MLAAPLAILLASLAVQENPFLRCAAIADDGDRLACFDRTAAVLTAVPAPITGPRAARTEPAPAAAAEPAPAATAGAEPETARRRFGLPQRRAEPDSVSAAVAELSLDRAGKLIVTLEDGQVWRQIGGDTTAVRLPRSGTSQTATIRRAALGSYRLRLEPLGRTVRVKRVE